MNNKRRVNTARCLRVPLADSIVFYWLIQFSEYLGEILEQEVVAVTV